MYSRKKSNNKKVSYSSVKAWNDGVVKVQVYTGVVLERDFSPGGKQCFE